jgi:hypothetical protein
MNLDVICDGLKSCTYAGFLCLVYADFANPISLYFLKSFISRFEIPIVALPNHAQNEKTEILMPLFPLSLSLLNNVTKIMPRIRITEFQSMKFDLEIKDLFFP